MIQINIGSWKSGSTMKIRLNDYNLLNYSTWATGTTGDIGQFNDYSQLSTVNSRVTGTDPFGNNVSLWKTYGGTTSGATGGGWITNTNGASPIFIPVDNTKTYRSSVWVKKASIDDAYMLFGCRPFINSSGTQGLWTDISTGTVSWNLYHTIAENTTNINKANEWRLHVGYIYPYTWTGTTDSSNTGVWSGSTKVSGNNGNGDIKFSASTTHIYQILLCQYGRTTTLSGSTGYAAYPRIDIVDGTEPSIATLLASEGPWRTVVGKQINIGGTWKTVT